MNRTLLLLFIVFILACNEKDVTIKFLGEWTSTKDSSEHCKITKAGKNFVFEHYYNYPDPQNLKVTPAFYDKLKDKLTIKSFRSKDLEVIYDNNSDQLIFEQIGAFKKTN